MTDSVEFPDDPGAFAARQPETAGAADGDPVYAVGIGPGNPEYLTRRGGRAIREADVVVGFETVVEFVADEITGEALTCGYDDEPEVLAEFADRVAAGASGTAVLMGDPNHSGYQFVGKVESAVEAPVRIVPGISSLQIAASRARTPDGRCDVRHAAQKRPDRGRPRSARSRGREATPARPPPALRLDARADRPPAARIWRVGL